MGAIEAEKLSARGVHVLVGPEGAEHRWHDDEPADLYSVSKGVAVLAAGIAVREGIIDPQDRPGDVLRVADLGHRVDEVSFLHLLEMRSGIDFEWFAGQDIPGADLAHTMLRQPSRGPGRVFQYSDASTYVAMRMLSCHVGDVVDWLTPRLFEPLGIPRPLWERCPRGEILGGSGLALRTSELARLGHVLRDDGRWMGRAIVPSDWVRAMSSGWQTTGAAEPWMQYGRGCWAGPGSGWRLDGLFGQYVYVSAAHDAVVTITANEELRDHRLVEIAAESLSVSLGC